MRRQFVRRTGSRGPSREWMSLNTWTQSAITATTATSLLGLEAPSPGSLTSMPAESLTVMRIVGEFSVLLSLASTWVLALTVQDATWTPSSLFRSDADKRILWSESYRSDAAISYWFPGGVRGNGGVQTGWDESHKTKVDIAPKVKLTPGQSLYLVAYEEAGAAEFTTLQTNMRILYQRSRR